MKEHIPAITKDKLIESGSTTRKGIPESSLRALMSRRPGRIEIPAAQIPARISCSVDRFSHNVIEEWKAGIASVKAIARIAAIYAKAPVLPSNLDIPIVRRSSSEAKIAIHPELCLKPFCTDP